MSKAGIFIAEGFEEVEALTVVDFCRRAGIDVITISIMGHKQVKGSHNIMIHTDEIYENVDFSELDAVVLPGGMPGTAHLQEHAGVNEQIRTFATDGRLTAAICAAPSVLGLAGILSGHNATVYPGFEKGEGVKWTGAPVVREGNLITGKGPGTAMLFALEIVSYLEGEKKAEEVRASLMMP